MEEKRKNESEVSKSAGVTKVATAKKILRKKKFVESEGDYVTFNMSGLSTPIAIIISAIILAVGVGLGLYFGLKSQTPATSANTTVTPTIAGDPYAAAAFPEATISVGNGAIKGTKATGKLVIVEFSDFMCIFCRQFVTGIDARTGTDTGLGSYEQILNDYVNTGKAALMYRHLPIQSHEPAATQLALASECVRQQGGDTAFYKFHDYVFAQFSALTNPAVTNQLELVRAKLEDAIAQTGVDKTKVLTCFDQKSTQNVLAADLAEINKLTPQIQSYLTSNGLGGIGTPAFVIGKLQADGTVKGKFIGGAYPYQAFKNVIEEQLNK